jgi:hypothetical protein
MVFQAATRLYGVAFQKTAIITTNNASTPNFSSFNGLLSSLLPHYKTLNMWIYE